MTRSTVLIGTKTINVGVWTDATGEHKVILTSSGEVALGWLGKPFDLNTDLYAASLSANA